MPSAVLEVLGVKMLTSPVGGRARQRVLILMICKKILTFYFREMLFGEHHVSTNAAFKHCNDSEMQ
jgi:hypothetical protein